MIRKYSGEWKQVQLFLHGWLMRYVVLFWMLTLATPALAQQSTGNILLQQRPTGSGGVSINDIANYTSSNLGPISPPSITLTGIPTTLTLNPNSTTNAIIETSGPIDFSTYAADTRWNMFQTTLSPSVNTGNVWENFNSFVTLNGTAQSTAEINVIHSFFQCSLGCTNTQQVETFESSTLNNGTLAIFDNNLAIFHNGSTGTITSGIQAFTGNLTQDNTTVGAVSSYCFICFGAMSGSGSTPTNYFFAQNKEAKASFASLGPASIGSFAAPATNTLLQLQGLDNTSSDFIIFGYNHSGTPIYYIDDQGSETLYGGTLSLGHVGSWTKLFVTNTTSNAIQISPPSSGALCGCLLTIPNPTGNDTLATLGLAQTFSATQTFADGGAWSSSGIDFGASSTGAGTQTFTNSPCTGLTTERWITVQIVGQTGNWHVPACQ